MDTIERDDLAIWCVGWNVLRMSDGMAGLLYNI